ncbi:MAG: hypothetical protein ACI9AP_001448, partial [Flavobacteriales bacterium]
QDHVLSPWYANISLGAPISNKDSLLCHDAMISSTSH